MMQNISHKWPSECKTTKKKMGGEGMCLIVVLRGKEGEKGNKGNM